LTDIAQFIPYQSWIRVVGTGFISLKIQAIQENEEICRRGKGEGAKGRGGGGERELIHFLLGLLKKKRSDDIKHCTITYSQN
jgi:hypothetical protein